jgi:hypothetical protein
LILHNLEKIGEIILNYLSKYEEIRDILLDILPNLFRDCQEYFYPIFKEKVILALVDLMDINKPETL